MVSLRNSSVMRDKKISRISWYPLLLRKFCRTRSFLKQRRVSLRNVSVLSDEKTQRKIVIPRFLSIKLFGSVFYETQKGFSTKSFSTLTQNVIDKIVIASLLEKKSRTRKLWSKGGILIEMFRQCDTKKRQNRDTPSYSKSFSEPEIFWIKERFCTKGFITDRQKVFHKVTIASLLEKKFQIQKFSETKEIFSTKCFGTVSWKKFKKNRDTPSYLKTFSERKTFRNKEGILNEIFWHGQTKNIQRKIVTPQFLPIKSSESGKTLKHWKNHLENFFVLWDIKYSTQNRDTPVPIHKNFR